MKIVFIHSLMFHHHTWQRAAEVLADQGIEFVFGHQSFAAELLSDAGREAVDLLIAEASPGMPGYDALLAHGRGIHARLGLSPEMPADFTTFSDEAAAEFKTYIDRVCLSNYVNGICFLAGQAGGPYTFAPSAPVQTTGIYHPRSGEIFDTVNAYEKWYLESSEEKSAARVGLLFYYTQMAEENMTDVDAIIRALESHGMMPVAVFSADVEDMDENREPPWPALFWAAGAEVILSPMAGRLFKKTAQVYLLQDLETPVIQLLRSHSQTPDQWQADPQGLPAMTTIYSLAQPEIHGAIAPVLVAGSRQDPDQPMGTGYRPFRPVQARNDTLCHRVRRWIHLRRTANRDKRITFVLHNNPCKGVEATVGMAVGLDTFESLARVLQEMKLAGYNVGDVPAQGREILETIMSRKAVAEFRWTTVDEIVRKGGALYMMDEAEYAPWFETLPEPARLKVLADWEAFPGQGMAFNDKGLHLLGVPPDTAGKARLLATILQTPPPNLPDVQRLAAWSGDAEAKAAGATDYELAVSLLAQLLEETPVPLPENQRKPLTEFCRTMAQRVSLCNGETRRLLQSLNGRFVPPGLSGAVSRGNPEVLPTGRNFFATDVTTLPTRAAWEMGRRMADKLLYKYQNEEGAFPESVGISIWSSDAFKSDGELLCQILALMGAFPVWDRQGRVRETEPMAPADLVLMLPDGGCLPRPRVDVVIQTSSLMRDLVPNFCNLLDRTVVMVSRLDESDEINFIRKHAREQMAQLREQTRKALSERQMQRMATLRVFSSAPGTYGLGVGLALDASAWQNPKDLAEAIRQSARAKLLNPAWIDHMRQHGDQGATAAASRVNNLFKWSATSGQVSKQLFDAVVQTYILDEANRSWLRTENPCALEEITRRFLEATSRGLWEADADLLAAVQNAALEIEGDMEEIMGEVQEEFQGGKVDVLTVKDVEKWKMEWRFR